MDKREIPVEKCEWYYRGGDPVATYREKYGEDSLIPRYCVTGNDIFFEKFNHNMELVYIYCLVNNKRWEEVLEFTYDPDVLY